MYAWKTALGATLLFAAGCVVEPAGLDGRRCDADRECLDGWFCNDQGLCVPEDGCGVEICDGVDNDCDGAADEGLPVEVLWPDADGDGAGDATAEPTRGCRPPIGFATEGGDCDDRDEHRRPGLIDPYGDHVDQDCDGADGVDGDGDGHAALFSGGDDCDDASALCTTDCTDLDEDGIPDCRDPCIDGDGDGYGSSRPGVDSTCIAPDCNDDEVACTTSCVDLDLDLVHDCADPCFDMDQDGYGAAGQDNSRCPNRGDDCDDTPGNDSDPDGDNVCNRRDNCREVPNPGQQDSDVDCDPLPFLGEDPACGDACDTCIDADRDGYGSVRGEVVSTCAGPDCDDDDPNAYPGAPERCNAKDDDCNGLVDDETWSEDADLDGICDAYDGCRTVFDPAQADLDGSCTGAPWADDPGCGDACQDGDGDGWVDAEDPCPRIAGDRTDSDGVNPIFFDEYFDDPSVLDTQWSGNDMASWEITGGYLRQMTDDPDKRIYNDAVALPDSYQMNLLIRPHDNDRFGVYLGYLDANNYDLVSIHLNNTGDGSNVDYALVRRRGGIDTVVSHWHPPSNERLVRDNWNRMIITVSPQRWILRFDHDGDGALAVVGGAPGAPAAGDRFGFLADDMNDLRIEEVVIRTFVPRDGIGDACDLCPGAYDPHQSDCDGDGVGDACDSDTTDDDGDGVDDACDVCVGTYDPLQSHGGHCTEPPYAEVQTCGDLCRDLDGDGVPDGRDNCPSDANPDQADGELVTPGPTTNAQGYATEWLFVGPWDSRGCTDLAGIDGLLQSTPLEGAVHHGRTWISATDPDGAFDWTTVFDVWRDRRGHLDDTQGYAALWFHLPSAGKVQLALGSDDSPSLWIDGRPQLSHGVCRGLTPDEDVVTVLLDAGWHGLVLRLSNGGGPWGHALRFRYEDGTPMPMATSIVPPFGDGIGDACDGCATQWGPVCSP